MFWWQVNGSELLTLIADTYGDLSRIPGWDEALVFDYSVDNRPPPTAAVVVEYWEALRFAYPNAEIVLSTLDDFAAGLAAYSEAHPAALPVVTQEMGDSCQCLFCRARPYGCSPPSPLTTLPGRAEPRRGGPVEGGALPGHPEDGAADGRGRRTRQGRPVAAGVFAQAGRGIRA